MIPVFSSILFVITQAFHIFYSDQTELMSESKRIFDEEVEMFLAYNAKCLPKAMFFSDVHESVFTCA